MSARKWPLTAGDDKPARPAGGRSESVPAHLVAVDAPVGGRWLVQPGPVRDAVAERGAK